MLRQEKNTSIPNFSYKSAFLILLSALIGSLFLPFLLTKIGITWKMLHVIVSAAVPAFTTSYCSFFIESDEGYSRRFWKVTLALFLVIGFISYFWMYELIRI